MNTSTINSTHDILTPAVLIDMLVDIDDAPTADDIVDEIKGAQQNEQAFVDAVINYEAGFARSAVSIARHRSSADAMSLKGLADHLNEVGAWAMFGGKAWNTSSIRRAHLVGLVVDDAPVLVHEVITLLGKANPSGAIKAVEQAEAGKAWEALAEYVKAEAKPEPEVEETEPEVDGDETETEEVEETTTDADLAIAILNIVKGWKNDGTINPQALVNTMADILIEESLNAA